MISEYPDLNHNGVPDVFEDRKPISVILQEDEQEQVPKPEVEQVVPVPVHHEGPPTVTLEIEVARRPPKRGEMYLDSDGTVRIQGYAGGISEIIVKRIIDAPPYFKPIQR